MREGLFLFAGLITIMTAKKERRYLKHNDGKRDERGSHQRKEAAGPDRYIKPFARMSFPCPLNESNNWFSSFGYKHFSKSLISSFLPIMSHVFSLARMFFIFYISPKLQKNERFGEISIFEWSNICLSRERNKACYFYGYVTSSFSFLSGFSLRRLY